MRGHESRMISADRGCSQITADKSRRVPHQLDEKLLMLVKSDVDHIQSVWRTELSFSVVLE